MRALFFGQKIGRTGPGVSGRVEVDPALPANAAIRAKLRKCAVNDLLDGIGWIFGLFKRV